MNKVNRMDMAARLASLRKQHGLTIEKLALMLGVSTSFVGVLEKGGSGVSIENLYKLAQIYGCSLDFLVTGKEQSKPFDTSSRSKLAVLSSALYGCEDEDIDLFVSLAVFLRERMRTRTASAKTLQISHLQSSAQ